MDASPPVGTPRLCISCLSWTAGDYLGAIWGHPGSCCQVMTMTTKRRGDRLQPSVMTHSDRVQQQQSDPSHSLLVRGGFHSESHGAGGGVPSGGTWTCPPPSGGQGSPPGGPLDAAWDGSISGSGSGRRQDEITVQVDGCVAISVHPTVHPPHASPSILAYPLQVSLTSPYIPTHPPLLHMSLTHVSHPSRLRLCLCMYGMP